MRRRQLFLALGFAMTALLGYWLAHTATPQKALRVESKTDSGPKQMVIVLLVMMRYDCLAKVWALG